jgi:hypothetical protein
MAVRDKQPGELAARMAGRLTRAARQRSDASQKGDSAFLQGSGAWRRESFTLPRAAAREKAREWFSQFPKAAYMTEIESWRELPDGSIEFTMRRLPSAD